MDLKLRSNKEIEKVDITTKLSWVAFQDQFFSSVLITNDFFLNGSVSSTRTLTSEKYIRYYTSEVGVPFNPASSNAISMKLYYGQIILLLLRKKDLSLKNLYFLERILLDG